MANKKKKGARAQPANGAANKAQPQPQAKPQPQAQKQAQAQKPPQQAAAGPSYVPPSTRVGFVHCSNGTESKDIA